MGNRKEVPGDLVVHGEVLPEGYWYFCSEPERPPDYGCVTDWLCPKCVLKSRAHLAARGDSEHTAFKGVASYTLAEILERIDAGEEITA